ncbi:hypothetical protein Trydic_g10170 [Trypoxylus dichotomus]
MLLNYLKATPHSKFILIEDSLDVPADPFMKFLIMSRLQPTSFPVHYAVYEGLYSKKQIPMVTTYDLTRNLKHLKEDLTLESIVENFQTPSFLFIDSIIHIIYKYGFREAYRLMHKIINNKNVLQVVTILHSDIIDEEGILDYFEHLSDFSISLETGYQETDRSRVIYRYRKPGGKVVKQVEEYYIEDGVLKVEAIKKIDPEKFLRDCAEQIDPHKLTTFKISLEENEKKARDSVVLPYLPRNEKLEEDGSICYELDAADDWDVEDPDDDLNI